MSKELSAKYDHLKVEADVYQSWVKEGYFTAGDLSKKPYSIVIPPPNVTGKLHLGHTWDNTLQDIIARYKRMQGYDMLYLPGMDHAGIATQAKVDQRLKEEGISRYDIGREKFLQRAWQWKEEYAATIRKQWATTGLSLDYSRERFTLDEGLSKAVRKVFVQLYNEGLIYRGERIINWDPQARTALSNIEVYHEDTKGAMYYFKYEVVETGQKFCVATTRPETMFGDVCVVVHPQDPRFKEAVGMHTINPANGQKLPIIADSYIDINFGTGAMKCTPAHDPNDFAIGKKYNLPMPVCINPDGTMNSLAGEYEGLDRFDCRTRLVDRIKSEGNLDHIEEIIHPVGHSERTHVIVEPYLSKQWFVKMKPLAQAVLDAQQDEETKINFYPPRFEKTFIQWLENIEDWCISRQLWWGHRIPAWYNKKTGEIYVSEQDPADPENWTQDEDVLDTWFSSALWPFSTLGWPDDTADLKRYYPTDCMVTGYDIIFFWVARMAFQGRHFTGRRPFKDVLIHGLIRDAQGRKMSKSLGNGVDPQDVVAQYGADALRFFITTNSTPGQDMRYIPEKVEAAWNFINKIWNAARFVEMNIAGFETADIDLSCLQPADQWIIDKFNSTISAVTANMDKYEFAIVGNQIYSFVWEDFCDWYIELAKSALQSADEKIVKGAKSSLLTVLASIIKMLHPFMPFVTEEIYASLPHTAKACCVAGWPQPIEADCSQAAEIDQLIAIIKQVRQLRVDYDIKPGVEFNVVIFDADHNFRPVDSQMAAALAKMAHVSWTETTEGKLIVRPLPVGSIGADISRVIDFEAESAKLEKEKQRLSGEIRRSAGMLKNKGFLEKAPAEKIEEEKAKAVQYQAQYEIVCHQAEELLASRN